MKITRRSALKMLTATAGGVSLLGDLTPNAQGDERMIEETPLAEPNQAPQDIMLWYPKPAEKWLEALPVGNGRLSAMVFGGIPQERLQLNEGTLWAGGPHDYISPEGLAALPEIRRLVFAREWLKAQALVDAKFMGRPIKQMPYQTVGNLTLTFQKPAEVSDYRRELDLDSAIARTSYTADGVRYTRETFVSAVDQVIVTRLTADKPGKIAFTATFDTPQKATVQPKDDHTLALEGRNGDANGVEGRVRFTALAHILPEGGSVKAETAALSVSGANAVTVLVSIATSYKNYQDVSGDSAAKAKEPLERAAKRAYPALRQAHTADFQKMFRRVSLQLHSANPDADAQALRRPTDERVQSFKNGNDPQLAALHYQYGRYLLLSCSRKGGQPATLQGLWNDKTDPPWGSKFTININTEMNYWPAAPANMLECYAPLFQMLHELSQAGQATAQRLYGAKGWVCHHNTDAWRGTAPLDGAFWGMWSTGGAWLAKSIWDHYEFTLDKAVLKEHYPVLKGATEFFLDALVEEPTHGWLVTCPAVSPENAHHPKASICAGPTMDNQILHDLFSATAQASEILGLDTEFRSRVTVALKRLPPMQIGSLGQLQEWLEDWDGSAPEQHHRHVSHLYGLFPSSQITRTKTPELFSAARKSMEMRGDMATGWSMGWKINLWARLLDGDRAHKLLSDLLTPERTAPNLFDLHPPFQIDGNFGAVSGVTEMLLQSHAEELHLLPALPSAWVSGEVRGIRARGGYTVDIAWEKGKLTRAKIGASRDGVCHLRLGERTAVLSVKAGKTYALDGAFMPPG